MPAGRSEDREPDSALRFDRAGADVGRALAFLADRQPNAPAMYAPGRTCLRYADLGVQIRYVHEQLSHWRIGRGDVVVGVIAARPEMAMACATLFSAATFAPLSATLTIDAYCELLRRLRPKALILSRGI